MKLEPTVVYESYWKFAAERLQIYYQRINGGHAPWTNDPILKSFRFTNVYRASDRVSQYLIRDVQYRQDRSQAPDEIFFRTILFKIFNKIETWETLERALGPVSWQAADFDKIFDVLDSAQSKRQKIYSAAYIMPNPKFGHKQKHRNHLALIRKMMADRVAARLMRARSLAAVYQELLRYSGIGPFLAYQYSIDLNYSNLLEFDEDDFVVAGPGALDGISKCFHNSNQNCSTEIILAMVQKQAEEFNRLKLDFPGLFGRPLKAIDCQNIFCEISKYSRMRHPEVRGVSGRSRIKQRYIERPAVTVKPFFPPKWRLNTELVPTEGLRQAAQLILL